MLETIKSVLNIKFPEGWLIEEQLSGLQPAFVVQPELLHRICLELRSNRSLYFDFLACLSGVDHGQQSNIFEVVYHLTSIPHRSQVVLKVQTVHDRSLSTLPTFQSVADIWPTAEWHEREAYDLVGIWFEGNPDLRRILLPDDWVGHPLRKDYQNPEYYKTIKVD